MDCSAGAQALACIDGPQHAMVVNPRVTRPQGTTAVIDAGESARRRCAPAGRDVTRRLRDDDVDRDARAARSAGLCPAPASTANAVQLWTAGLLACIGMPQPATPVNP